MLKSYISKIISIMSKIRLCKPYWHIIIYETNILILMHCTVVAVHGAASAVRAVPLKLIPRPPFDFASGPPS